jgi:hypothetical protein
MPSQARRTRPAVISALMMRCVVLLIGTADDAVPATAVLTPTIRLAAVGEHAPAVPRVECCVGLDHLVDNPALSGWQRAAERGHNARRHASRQAERVADRDNELADLELAGVTQFHRARDLASGAEHREVGEGIPAGNVRG